MPAVVLPKSHIKRNFGLKATSPGSFWRRTLGAMEPGYLQIDWNTIPGLYNRKRYLRTLVIGKKEWDHLSDPA